MICRAAKRCEESDCCCDILRLVKAAKGAETTLIVGEFPRLGVRVSICRSRLDEINRYISGAQFAGEATVECLERAFGHIVDRTRHA